MAQAVVMPLVGIFILAVFVVLPILFLRRLWIFLGRK